MRRAAAGAFTLALLLSGCNGSFSRKPPAGDAGAADASSQPVPDDPQSLPSSEAQRTRAMEEKKAEMDRKVEEARAGGLSQEELDRLTRELEADRQELNRMSEGPPPADDGAADYPPPPR